MLNFRRYLFLFLLLPAAVLAQDVPKVDVFGGYSYMRLESVNLSGGMGSVTGYVNHRFGLTGEFSYYAGKETVIVNNINTRVNVTKIPFLFGPQISFRNQSRTTPFVRGLIGAARERGVEPETAFAASVGSGVDFRLSKKISWRVQGDYLITRKSDTENIIRISTGLVFHFGK